MEEMEEAMDVGVKEKTEEEVVWVLRSLIPGCLPGKERGETAG